MPQVRSAKVISTPPCTRPRRLWCLSSVIRAYSCSPSAMRCHSGPIRCRKPEVSTIFQPSDLSFVRGLGCHVALSVPCGLSCCPGHFIWRATCCSQAGWPVHLTIPPGGISQSCCAAFTRAARRGGAALKRAAVAIALTGAETGRRNHVSADPPRREPALPRRAMGAAGRALRRRRDAGAGRAARIA